MLQLQSPLTQVTGIGPTTAEKLTAKGIHTVQDLLLTLPLRYEDRSQFLPVVELSKLSEKQTVSVQAKVTQVSQFNRGRRRMQTASVTDGTGTLKLMWFNSPFVLRSLKRNETYVFSGAYDPKYKSMSQATFEPLRADMIHTGRIVPLYTSTLPIAQGTFRRILKRITDDLTETSTDLIADSANQHSTEHLPTITTAVKQLHFPDDPTAVDHARRRLALEEFLTLMGQAKELKDQWHALNDAPAISSTTETAVPSSLPFTLTNAQTRSISEILADVGNTTPMNRLLIGDVGSGKTVVAGAVAAAFLTQNWSVAFVAPTKILAEQHAHTLPDIPVQLITKKQQATAENQSPALFVGTHRVINQLTKLQPGLIIYDEQHRFGVSHRSASLELDYTPHILTMTATPIPRSLMLTIFAHLKVSHIDELPPSRKPVKTWLSTKQKRTKAYAWMAEELTQTDGQAIVVCPFIEPSDHDAFDNVAATTDVFAELQALNKTNQLGLQIGLLHGRQKPAEQQEVISQLYAGEINLLVTTPIVEVGVDLPKASMIAIESAERFGLASLHQLRGRVGRAGQQGYCVLFSDSSAAKDRLQQFCQITEGKELAELDLQRRGSGDLFGTQQSGFDQLRFASWTDVELISLAQQVFTQLPSDWKPLIPPKNESTGSVLSN